jgi:predicted nucleic acid-binding Zn ribbon protein
MPRYLYRCSECAAVFESVSRIERATCRKSGCPGTATLVKGVVNYLQPSPANLPDGTDA